MFTYGYYWLETIDELETWLSNDEFAVEKDWILIKYQSMFILSVMEIAYSSWSILYGMYLSRLHAVKSNFDTSIILLSETFKLFSRNWSQPCPVSKKINEETPQSCHWCADLISFSSSSVWKHLKLTNIFIISRLIHSNCTLSHQW